jgi:outer membrane protein assembly factor BamB
MKLHLPFILIGSLLVAPLARGEDWPMWRYDAGRTAASGEKLPDSLQLEWERVFSPREPVWDDPLNHDLMPYDRIFEPVILGDRMFIGFNDSDKVVALDLNTGAELWTRYADGPVRLPPVAWEGKVYFVSDDGRLHCVRADDGSPVWAFDGAPSRRKALGNRRIVSAWPARGGPVLRDGTVYFAASIWPFMGTFIHALNAETGRVMWVNDGTGADFIKQPHSAPSFAGVAPQGALVATRDTLLVPGGRTVPAAFDRATGALRYFHLNQGGKGNGGSFVAANDTYFYLHTRERGVRVFDVKTGEAGKSTMNEPVIAGDRLYAAAVSEKGDPVVREMGTSEKVYWEVAADGSGDLILAGDHLYATGAERLSAIALPKGEGEKPRVTWSTPVGGTVLRLLAARGKLIAVTRDGRILAYGAGPVRERIETPRPAPSTPTAGAVAAARNLLDRLDDRAGYGLVFGADDRDLIDALIAGSDMRLAVVDPDSKKVEALRRHYDALGLYGSRVTAHPGDPVSFQAPPHIAHLVVMAGPAPGADALRAAHASVRPYGGILCVADPATPLRAEDFENARLVEADGRRLIIREGALPGSADWTHQYGDIGNTVKSDDTRVRAPLGVLWFGGNSNLDVLPRHGHGPPEQVVGGRLYIQGMNSISARDVYTGRVIWKHDFGDLGTFGIYYNETYTDSPLSTAYNQKHIPGANGRGTNYVATPEAVYVAVHGECRVLDAATGAETSKIRLRDDPDDPAQWGFIGVYGDLLIGGDDFSHPSLRLGGAKSRAEATIEDYSASDGLAVYDRHDGRLLWRAKARYSFLHNGIVAGGGLIYCLDKLTTHGESLLRRRGTGLPEDYRIVAYDARTGREVWHTEKELFGTWLGYSAQHDVLLQAGARASDRLSTEVGNGMVAYSGKTGVPLWRDLQRSYTGPCILHNGSIITGANSYANSGGVFDLLTGHPRLVENPLTGRMEPLRLNRTYGCNTIVASEHLLTYRSGAAGYYDLETLSGTANLGGFKSGCTSNLIVANGVLNAPDYTRTCSCAYQNQTSLALIHMPEMEMWTYSQFGLDGGHGDRVLRAGINFGAPGSRRAPDGTLWLEHPHTGTGNSPRIGVEGLADTAAYYRRHSGSVDGGDGHPWVGASGLIGAGEIVITPSLRRPLVAKPAKTGEPAPEQEPLLKVDHPPLPHTVRLFFSEPAGLAPGARVFDVRLQGKTVLTGFDIAREAGAAADVVMREFTGISIGRDLRIELVPAAGSPHPPALSGVEFMAPSPGS